MAENREFKSSQDLVDVSSLLAEKTKEFEGTDNHLGLNPYDLPSIHFIYSLYYVYESFETIQHIKRTSIPTSVH